MEHKYLFYSVDNDILKDFMTTWVNRAVYTEQV